MQSKVRYTALGCIYILQVKRGVLKMNTKKFRMIPAFVAFVMLVALLAACSNSEPGKSNTDGKQAQSDSSAILPVRYVIPGTAAPLQMKLLRK